MTTGRDVELFHIPADSVTLEAVRCIPDRCHGIVLFAHGSGSSRHSPRNNQVARALRDAGVATLLLDLLTEREAASRVNVFDVNFLAERLAAATDWVRGHPDTRALRVGYFGASTGAAAALIAAARNVSIRAVVSRGGRPDLAGDALADVRAPTLLIVGGDDVPVIALNQQAYARLRCEKDLTIVSGAGHLFEEPGTLAEVIRLASDWYGRHLGAAPRRS